MSEDVKVEPVIKPQLSTGTEASLTFLTGVAAMLSSSAVLPSTMLAAIGDSQCSLVATPEGREWKTSPMLYVLSPFYGNSLYMVVGNFGLVAGFAFAHAVVVCAAAAIGRQGDAKTAMVRTRFPHYSILFALLGMLGIQLGSWQLLWASWNNKSVEGMGKSAKVVVGLCGLMVSIVPAAGSTWMRRTLFTEDDGNGGSRVGLASAVINSDAPSWAVWLLARFGPHGLWTPEDEVLRVGAAFAAYSYAELVEPWILAEHWGVGLVLMFICAADPPVERATEICDGLMFTCAALMLIYAVMIVVLQPYLLVWRNKVSGVVVLLLATSLGLHAPSSLVSMGVDNTQVAVNAVNILLCLAVLILCGLLLAVHIAEKYMSPNEEEAVPSTVQLSKIFGEDAGGYDADDPLATTSVPIGDFDGATDEVSQLKSPSSFYRGSRSPHDDGVTLRRIVTPPQSTLSQAMMNKQDMPGSNPLSTVSPPLPRSPTTTSPVPRNTPPRSPPVFPAKLENMSFSRGASAPTGNKVSTKRAVDDFTARIKTVDAAPPLPQPANDVDDPFGDDDDL